MLFGDRELDVDGGQDGEDVRLEDGHEEFEHREGEAEGERSDAEQADELPLASTVKKKKCVAAKQSTSSRWPTIMFISESERQRDRPQDEGREELERHSRKYSGHGTPGRNSESFKNLPPFLRMPAYMNMIARRRARG